MRRASPYVPQRLSPGPVRFEDVNRNLDEIKACTQRIVSDITDLSNGVGGDVINGSYSYAQLRLTRADPRDVINCYGRAAIGDGGEGTFYWDPSLAVDDDGTKLRVGAGLGGWVRRDKGSVRPGWFGAKSDGSNSIAAIIAAVNAALLRKNKTVVIDEVFTISTNGQTIPAGAKLKFELGGQFTGPGLSTLNNLSEIEAGRYKIFGGAVGNYGIAEFARAEWWGVKADGADHAADLQVAINSVLTGNSAATRRLVIGRGYINIGSTITIDQNAVGSPYCAFSIEGETLSLLPDYATTLKWTGGTSTSSIMFDCPGVVNMTMKSFGIEGDSKLYKHAWIRPKYNGATLVSGAFGCLFDHVRFTSAADLAGAAMLSLGDAAHPDIQVSEIDCHRCVFSTFSHRVNTYVNEDVSAWKTETGGNVKNFNLTNCSFTFNKVSVNWFKGSGILNIVGCYFDSNRLDLRNNGGTMSVTGCSSESSWRLLENANAGPNAVNTTFTSCVFSMWGAATDPYMDYQIVAAGNVSLNNCLMNKFGYEFKINCEGNWSSINSQNNVFLGSTGFPLFYLGQRVVSSKTISSDYDELIQRPETAKRLVFISKGDKGGTGSILEEFFPSLEYPASTPFKLGPSFRQLAGWSDTVAGMTKVQDGPWTRLDIDLTAGAFKDAALTQTLKLCNWWQRTHITGALIDVKVAVTGPAGPITASLGLDGDDDGLLLATSVTAVSQIGRVAGDLGVFLQSATLVQGGTWFWNVDTLTRNLLTLKLTAASNLGNGTTTNITAGTITIWVKGDVLP